MNDSKVRVALRRWTDFAGMSAVLGRCLEDPGGIDCIVRPGRTVVIKPNLTANAPSSSGGTTHVELVEAIGHEVQRCRPGRVVVAEGAAGCGGRRRMRRTPDDSA